MLWQIFILGSPFFWAFVIVELVLLSIFVANEFVGPSFIVLIVFPLTLWLFGDFNLFSYAWIHWPYTLLCFVGYTAIGFLWAIGKFYLRLSGYKREYQEKKETWLKRNQGKTEDDWLKENHRQINVPDFRRSASQIVFWMTYWPVSMFWTLINDPIRRFFQGLYNLLSGIFRRVYNTVLGGMISDQARANFLFEEEERKKEEEKKKHESDRSSRRSGDYTMV